MKPLIKSGLLLALTLFLTFIDLARAGYDPTIGRWLSRDPIGEDRGWNLYGYVSNNPISLWDPFGLELCEADQERLGSYIDPAEAGSAFELGLQAFRDGGRQGLMEHFSTNPRYSYNRKTGWVDMQHVAAAAGVSERSFPPMGQIFGLGVELSQALNSVNPFRTAEERADQRSSACKREDFNSNAIGDVASIMGRFPEGQALLGRNAAHMKLNPADFMRVTPPALR